MIKNFRGLLDDNVRINAFRQAIDYLVNDKKNVLEIGTGLGTYAFFAAQNQAKNIYAVEMDDIFHVAVELAKRNGLADKINFINAKSTEINLPEKVDYIIMEDYSPFFIYENLETIISDAQKRFLKNGGQFIPNIIIPKIAPVGAKTLHQEIDLWQDRDNQLYDINWDYTTELAFNRPYYAEYHKLIPLTKEQKIKTINLSTDQNFPFSFRNTLTIEKSGTIHGLAGWWDCYFSDTQFFSNSPLAPSNTWGQLFFPFQYPVEVKKGDQIKIEMHVIESKTSKQINYKWKIEHSSTVQEQNSFRASFLTLEDLEKKNSSSRANLNPEGEIAYFILHSLKRGIPRETIGIQLDKEFSTRFLNKKQKSRIFYDILENFI